MPRTSQFTIKLDSFCLEWNTQDLGTGRHFLTTTRSPRWVEDSAHKTRKAYHPWDRRSQGRLCSCYWPTALCDGGIFLELTLEMDDFG